MTRSYKDIFSVHFKTKQSLMLWGSSGYGKTSLVQEYARENGFEFMVVHAQYLDPLALFIPATAEMKQIGFARMYPTEILHRVFTASSKTLLFLDEITRAREETFNILTELLLDRAVFGFKVPDHVLMVAASNFAEEDSGVRDLPDAVMQRLTHLIHAPELGRSAEFMRSPSARALLAHDPKLVRKPSRFPIFDALRASPRQIDACGLMADAGLRGESLMDVCRGRVGVEAGTEIAMRLEMHLTGKVKILPERIDAGEFTRIARAEKDGGVLEVVRFLCEQMNELGKAPSIAQYLLEFASPEVCRSMQVHGFGFSFQQAPRQSNGKFFMTPARVAEEAKSLEAAGKPWQWYAMRLGKLTPR